MKKSPLFNTLLSSGLPGHGYELTTISPAERAAFLGDLLARTDIRREDGPAITVVEIASENTLHVVTQQGHFAHPSMLTRTLGSSNGMRSVAVSVRTCASVALAQDWINQFRQQDQTMAHALKR
jgi:hypothetical protein